MRTRAFPVIGGLVMAVWLLAGPGSARAQGQAELVQFRGIQKRQVQPPDYGSAGSNLGSRIPSASRSWWEVEVEYETAIDWVDEVQIKFYVLLGKGREAKLCTGQLTTVNLSKGRHYSAMFIQPNTVDRYGGGRVDTVAAQLYYQGRLVSQIGQPALTQVVGRWWEQYTPTQGELLAPNLTPWAVIAYQRFEALKAGQ